MRLIVFMVLFFTTVVVLTAIFFPDPPKTLLNSKSSTEQTGRIQEDEPGWDCRTMGNHICGPKEYSTPKFQFYSDAFNCFAEIDYTEPTLSWNARVSRCIPDSPAP